MQIAVKLAITVAVILLCTQVARKVPSLAGLIATMPLAGFIVLIWIATENSGNSNIMVDYTKGALWGILPSILFYIMALICFRKGMPLPVTLSLSFLIWLVGAVVHQILLR